MFGKLTRDEMIARMFQHKSHYLVFDNGENRYASGMMNCVGVFECLEDAARKLGTYDSSFTGNGMKMDGEKIPAQHILHIDNSIDGTQSLKVLYYDEHGDLHTELLTDLEEREV